MAKMLEDMHEKAGARPRVATSMLRTFMAAAPNVSRWNGPRDSTGITLWQDYPETRRPAPLRVIEF